MDATRKVVGIADTDEESLADLRAALQKLGKPVLASQNGSDLVTLFRNGTLSILITDTELKDMTGLDLISTIREVDSGFPVVVTTSDYSKELELACRKLGIVFYARKPLNFEVIKWIVNRNLTSADVKAKRRLRKVAQRS
ncbi:MAG: response regulator [bacterium]